MTSFTRPNFEKLAGVLALVTVVLGGLFLCFFVVRGLIAFTRDHLAYDVWMDVSHMENLTKLNTPFPEKLTAHPRHEFNFSWRRDHTYKVAYRVAMDKVACKQVEVDPPQGGSWTFACDEDKEGVTWARAVLKKA